MCIGQFTATVAIRGNFQGMYTFRGFCCEPVECEILILEKKQWHNDPTR